ncbi:MAG: helix-turn-helix transcriptional regulator [Lachnospiraceae bacterium]|nr:helix-turn-helix transcriptional regulator [Lachnospiraceae bacterium]
MINGLPEKLKDLRIKYGLSQKDVATRLGISPSIVSGYETGDRTPSTENLLALSYLYNCTTDYLLGRDTSTPDSILDVTGLTPNQILSITNLINSIRDNR